MPQEQLSRIQSSRMSANYAVDNLKSKSQLICDNCDLPNTRSSAKTGEKCPNCNGKLVKNPSYQL